MREGLSFVIAGASAVKVITAYLRIERRRAPLLKRLRSLNVVVAVDDERGTTGQSPPRGIDNRMAARGNDANLCQADAAQVIGQPVGALFQIIRMLWLRTDGRKAEKRFQFVDKPGPMSASIVESVMRIQGSPQFDWALVFVEASSSRFVRRRQAAMNML